MLLQIIAFPQFLRLNSIPIVCIYHSFFIYSSVDGHLGYFHVLAVIQNITVNMGVWISFGVNVFISSISIPTSGNARSYSSSNFNFWRFLHRAVPIYILIKSAQGFPFLHILTSICYLLSFLMMAILTGVR